MDRNRIGFQILPSLPIRVGLWAESSSESSSSMGAAVGFSFRFADGSAVTNRGSLEAEGAFFGAGSAGSGGGPCGGGRAPKAEVGCQNRLRWGKA